MRADVLAKANQVPFCQSAPAQMTQAFSEQRRKNSLNGFRPRADDQRIGNRYSPIVRLIRGNGKRTHSSRPELAPRVSSLRYRLARFLMKQGGQAIELVTRMVIDDDLASIGVFGSDQDGRTQVLIEPQFEIK
jgi:hypothetical protein